MFRPKDMFSHLPSLRDKRRRRDLICKLIKKYLFVFIQFPCYDYNEFVEKTADIRHQVDPAEYKEYENCSSKNKSFGRLCVLIFLTVIYSFKNYYFQAVNKIDMSDPETVRSNQWRIDENTLQVACVQTNCTDFPRDIRQFSLVHICHPAISAIYPPTTFLGPYASLMHGVIAIIATAWGLMALDHYFIPLKCDTIMFLVAPKLTRYPMIVSARQIYQDYKASCENYLKFIEVKRMRYRSRLYVSNMESINGYRVSRIFRTNYREQLDRRYLSNNLFDLSGSNPIDNTELSLTQVTDDKSTRAANTLHDQATHDYLPPVRTMWWHSEAQDVFISALIRIVLAYIADNAMFIIDFWRRYLNKVQDAVTYRREMSETGCRAWFVTESGAKDVLSIEYVWTMQVDILAMIDNLFLMLIMLVSCCLGALFYLIKYELNYWRSDIDNNLKLLIDMTRSQSNFSPIDYAELRYDYGDNEDRASPKSDNGRLEDGVGPPLSTPGHVSSPEPITQEYLQLMAKLYVSFRLFMKHVERCSNTSPLLSFITLLLAYGITLMSVLHGRYLRQFSREHMFITFMSIAYAASFLTFMSSFHAKCRKTERTFWTLIAALSEFDPPENRIEHFKLLWLKQLRVISDEGGISLKIYHVRMTHVNVLQALLGTVSIIALVAY